MSEIDPKEFGALQAKVDGLESKINELSTDVKNLLALANQSRGSLWAGMTLASAFGAVVTWAAAHLSLIPR